MTAEEIETSGGRPSGLTRRRLLAGFGGVGAVGMAGGTGTFAYLSDSESFTPNTIGAGDLELLVDGDPFDGRIPVDVGEVDRGKSGDETLTLSVRTNPARIWLATDCPDPAERLGEALRVQLRIDGRSESGDWQSFDAFRRAFVDGLRLDDDCLDPADDLELALHWRLPNDVDDAVAGSSTSFDFQLYAEQCRHVSEAEAAGSNPFAGLGPCDEPATCAVCEDGDRYAQLTFEYRGSGDAYVTARVRGAGQTGVAFEGTLSPGDTFTADGANVGGSNDLGTNLYLDDGSDDQPGGSQGQGNGRPPGVKVHTSCSEDLFVGDEFGPDDRALYRLVAGEIAGKGSICDDSVDHNSTERR